MNNLNSNKKGITCPFCYHEELEPFGLLDNKEIYKCLDCCKFIPFDPKTNKCSIDFSSKKWRFYNLGIQK
jgi:hypothetical protein